MAKKRVVLGALMLGFASAGAGYGWYWWTEARFVETTDDAYVRADQSPVAAKVDGYVKRIAAAENVQVKAGDPLVEIDATDYAARAAQADAAVAARWAARTTFDDQIALQKRVVRQSEAQIPIAQAELTRAQEDRDRYAKLARENAASRQKYDYAIADFKKASAELDAARAAVATERQRLAVLDAQAREADEAVLVAEAAARTAALEVEHTHVKAPIDGIVGNRTVAVGQYVRPGTQLMVLVPLKDVYVVANYKETQVAAMKIGQKVEMKIDAFPGKTFGGTIDSFAPATGSRYSLLPPENATGNFTKIVQRVPVRIHFDPDTPMIGAIRSGMSVVVHIDTRGSGRSDRSGS